VELEQLISSSRPFLGWVVDWYNNRPTLDLAQVIEEAGGSEKVAVLAVDVTVGFCSEGALASERVAGIVDPIAGLFERAYELGVRHFVLPQDTHSEDAVEFSAFPPHCVAGTDESATMPRLLDLPFSGLFTIIEKDSVCVAIDTKLDTWLEAHPEVTAFVTVGDCTDFCTHRMAMHLRLRANARKHHDARVILPIDGVNTFHIPAGCGPGIGHYAPSRGLVASHLSLQYGAERGRGRRQDGVIGCPWMVFWMRSQPGCGNTLSRPALGAMSLG
jgi:nicotinamidase-related amidase